MHPNKMDELLAELKKAHALACKLSGGYSEGFLSAEEFSAALGNAISELETGNDAVIEDLYLWFLPTSDWDDFIKIKGLDLGQRVLRLLTTYRANK